ncbi:MAG: amidohydrolase family protein [Elusimicrobiota bacterium]|nr:MAG: amidohydrolase family protein [Elusimicrobiota bacterium]
MIDVHVHLAALPTKANGCLLSKDMLGGALAKLVAWHQGLPLDEPERANAIFVDRVIEKMKASTRVEKGVLLALDGIYGDDGRLDEARTHMLISNDAMFDACARSGGRLLPGASINPARRDALDELERCAARGAVLIKVLPNAQVFDPAAKRFTAFYRALARHKIPLLSHIGVEYSVKARDQAVGNPERLERALKEGATVIAAHACSSGHVISQPHVETMVRLVREQPRFFMDASALTLPNRVGIARHLRRHPETFERLLFGSDYPLPVLWPGSNPFDRHAAALEALGVRCGADAKSVLRL